MRNFVYYNPVRVVFGKGTISSISELIPKDKKVMMIYGGGSIKKNGVYEQVKQALNGYKIVEFSGIEPNPAYETCMEAVKIVKEQKIDFLLAVGGGSVLDGTKFIAAAAKFEDGDPWKILSEGVEIKSALPLASVITLPATGSEMNAYAVISKKATAEKFGLCSWKVAPVFSVIDPETTYSLPRKQLINGLVDIFVHVLEQYVTFNVNSPLQDRQSESILSTIVEISDDVLNKANDYESRATQGLNGLIACGVPQDWATHKIGHELTALYGIDHGESLAIVLPEVWKYNLELKKEKILQYGERVFGISKKNADKAAMKIIKATEKFFQKLGIKTKLSEYGIDSRDAAEKISTRFESRAAKLGEKGQLLHKDVKKILLNC
jgi:NADP-dependent alcohol dehydrogenase